MESSLGMRAGLFALVCVVAFLHVGCEGTASSGASTTLVEGGSCTPDPDPIDPECNVCVAPGGQPPAFDGALVLQGEESLPPATGGDLVGSWIVAGVTVYLPSVVTTLADLSQSSFDGSGWFVLAGDGSFRFAVDGTARIKLTSSDTPLEMAAGAGGRGSYQIHGDTIDFSPECQFTDNPMGQDAMQDGTASIRLSGNPFSAGADQGQIQLQMTVQNFPVDIVADLVRVN